MKITQRLIYITSFNMGLTIMASEMGTGRLLAPYYGTSTMIWSLLIGIVMMSLAVGNLIGGWLSKQPHSLLWFWRGLFLSAFFLFLLPLSSTFLLSGTLALFYKGAFLKLFIKAFLFLFLLSFPMIILGTSNPILIHHLVETMDETGTKAGKLYAINTIGSLLGTFASGLFLVPLLGIRESFWIFSLLLAMNAVVGLSIKKLTKIILSISFVIGLFFSFLLPQWSIHPNQKRFTLYEANSRYNHIWITERHKIRRLFLNEGYATQSLYYLNGKLPLFDVWGYYGLSPAWTKNGHPKDILLIGLGGGSSARILRAFYPKANITGVERDPLIIKIGQKFLGMPHDINAINDGGRTFLSRTNQHYDVIIVDAFQFPYIPFQLATQEFFKSLKQHLKKTGVLVMNVGRDRHHYAVVDAIFHTLKSVFPHLQGVDVLNNSNTILVATRHPPQSYIGLKKLHIPQKWKYQLDRLLSPHYWRLHTKPILLTDNYSPVEWLTDRIIFQRLFQLFLPHRSKK